MQIDNDLNIRSILFNKHNSLGKLCYLAKKLKAIDDVFQNMLHIGNQDLVNYCRIGGIQNNCLTIETSRSEYLTTLKFNSQELLSKLRQLPELSQIITIKYKVCPELEHIKSVTNSQNQKLKKRQERSPTAKNYLSDIANNIKDSALKQALLKLAE